MNIADTPQHISAQDARGGEIVLRTRAPHLIFLAGLVGMIVLAVVLMVLEYR